MKRKLPNTTRKIIPLLTVLVILLIWQCCSSIGWIPRFMLPSPTDVVKALIADFPLLMSNAKVTLLEALIGLTMGVLIGFIAAVIMDGSDMIYQALYPLLVITQTVPTVALAPLLVLWFGYEMTPKILLIVIVTFFPITVSLLNGFRSTDPDTLQLMRSMGAGKVQTFFFVKLPGALGQFFSGLKMAASYAVVGAVIAEWLGGFMGLGVYMTKVRKAYSFDKMFAVIFLVSTISLLLMRGIDLLQKKCMPWEEK